MPDPPVLRFDHLGIVVSELAEGRAHLKATLGITQWTEAFDDHRIGVRVQFGAGESGPAMELIAPLGTGSPVAHALLGGKRILNHLAYRTEDLAASAAALVNEGCVATGPAMAAEAYGGKAVQFFVSPLRFIIELIEAPGHEHVFVPGAKGETRI